ncbi:MAG: tyrosine-type recombinase/integrase [Phycisphaerae bacterium]|nr:tyrosine-type recombinase/integrase [Phycisphaerae bacterium]
MAESFIWLAPLALLNCSPDQILQFQGSSRVWPTLMATGKVTIHCLRKSWASNLANAGVPSNTLMKMGGWSNIETVLKYYLKSSDENEKKAVRILDRLMGVEVGGSFVGKKG